MAEMTADSVRAGFEELSKYRRPCNVCGRSWSVVKEDTSESGVVFCAIIHLRGREETVAGQRESGGKCTEGKAWRVNVFKGRVVGGGPKELKLNGPCWIS